MHIIYISKFKFWKTPTKSVYKQTKCKQNMKQESRARQYSIVLGKIWLHNTGNKALKNHIFKRNEKYQIPFVFKFPAKVFFFLKLYCCLLPVPIKFWGNF